jgi:predicted DNA-binding transcriptional regulator YafY
MNKGHSVLGVVTGKPLTVGGSLGREEATARGSLYCIREAIRKRSLSIQGLRVAIQGFGNVGSHLARLLAAADAIGDRVAVRFTYRTSRGAEARRDIDPYGLVVRGGQWYVVGLDRERGEIRSFRFSRMVGDLERGGRATPPPEGFKAADHVAAGPWGPGEPREHVLVALSPDVAWWATSGVRGVDVVETRDDGWQVHRVPTGPGDGIVSWVLSFGPDAELLEPSELRAEIVRRLETLGG